MKDSKPVYTLGVLSDTHGALAPKAVERLKGAEAILHAGDVGSSLILFELEAIAPTYAVLGNTDPGTDCDRLPLQRSIELGGLRIYMAHGHLHADPGARIRGMLQASREFGPDLIVVGHSHRPYVGVHEGVMFLNPGSASRPRYGHPASVARVEVRDGKPHVRLMDLEGREITPDTSI